jgi:superfamily II DNA or RNA helicase
MTKFKIEDFEKSLHTGFIDKSINSELLYQPELLVNRKKPRKKVLSTIISELEKCESFFISVAFVTSSGVTSLRNSLEILEQKGIKGKIVVSQYLNFTEPEALRKLLKYKNIELRIATNSNSHSKGYLFKTANHYNLIVGSSNLTGNTLSKNKEWNLKVSAMHTSEIVEKVLNEFNDDFDSGEAVTEKFIAEYEETYNKQRLFYKDSKQKLKPKEITPNLMQIEALVNIKKLRDKNKTKALLISATGTGKTYLSAFDAKAFQPKKLLFVVHRRTIAEKPLKTFKSIFGDSKSMGMYSGYKKELDCDFIFSTVQTISKQENLNQFYKTHFDYIIIDESHRSGATSYLRLLDYFNSKFLLGITATPERTDGNDIFSLFDHNIAYEIRLNRAMEEEMLAPFHYFGVTDVSVDDVILENDSDFNLLTANERVEKIISKAKLYGSDNGITRGLVFCAKVDEAIELSNKFNENGLKTIALTGANSEDERINAIDKLESDDLAEKLDYIFTVDIFNEGIDIPRVNQIIMMRPTDSAIIFIQQLGRGLRKTEGKDYVTIIDFIGNYSNNYLIPIALYGETSYNKDSLRRLMSEGSRMIPGSSTINFDRISKEKIFNAIDSANLQKLADLKNDYELLKYKLGRIPLMMDFILHGSRDPYLYVEYSKSYYNFILKVEKDYENNIPEKGIKLLEFFSKEINNAKRITESVLLKELINNNSISFKNFKALIKKKFDFEVSKKTIVSTISNLNFEFIREKKDKQLKTIREIYSLNIINIEDEEITPAKDLIEYLKQDDFKKFLFDSTEQAIYSFNKKFELENWRDGFILYQKYTRKDVFRILNTSENPVAQNVGGYLVSTDNTNCPIFVNYHKDDSISESTKYEDEFVNNKEFNWMSKSNRKLRSKDVQSILGVNIRLPLFIKKSNDESAEFYYMGDVTPNLKFVEQTTMKNDSNKDVSVVKIRFNLQNQVPENLYNYITESTEVINDSIPEKSETKGIKPIFTLPLYDFYAAAGSFSEMQSDSSFTPIEADQEYDSNYFACEVIGESMNRRIPNGSICLFKKYTGGSRNGKIVLVENRDFQNTEFNSAFTIKTYNSKKQISEKGWSHESIVLTPNSYDSSFKSIIINEDNGVNMNVVAEFIKVLS